MSLKSILALVSMIVLCSVGMAVAQVQDDNARVTVPDFRGGARVSGCYIADRGLYGPYRVSFCLQRRGSYTVRGDRLRCDGDLSWNTRGRDIRITLRRASCGRGVSWAAANINCRARDSRDMALDKFIRNKLRAGDQRVVIPENTSVERLLCTYEPSVRGERPTGFLANRLRR